MTDPSSDAADDPPDGDGVGSQGGVSRLRFDIEWPPNHAAAYLFAEPAPILVDAGDPTGRGRETVLAELSARGYEPSDLAAVVVTHPHSDHIGQVPLFREADVPVYAAEPTLEQLGRDEADLEAGVRDVGRSAGVSGEAIDAQVERARESLRRNRRLLAPASVTPFSLDEPFTAAGREFEPIHTPGHQVHHASLVTTVGDERALVSGDVLLEPFRAAALHVGLDYGAYDAIEAFFTSMDRLAGLDVERVYPGHGPVFADADGAVADTRRALEALVDDTLAAVDDVGPATPVDVTRARIGERRQPAGMLDTLGALGTLSRRDRVAFDDRDGVRYVRSI